MRMSSLSLFFFFFNDTATTEIYTLSLHDALPISDLPKTRSGKIMRRLLKDIAAGRALGDVTTLADADRKSTRLNSSHDQISYAVFCLKKKKKQDKPADGVALMISSATIIISRMRA